MKARVLLVDDEVNVLSALKRALWDEPWEIESASSAEEALQLLERQTFKVVISDERMTGMQGSEFLARVKESYPKTVRILLTGHATLDAAMMAVNNGEIYRFFTKPWNDHDIRFAIRSALEKYDLETENRRLFATVQQQEQEFRRLEKSHPGITHVTRTHQGSYILPELSDEDMARLISECTQEVDEKREAD